MSTMSSSIQILQDGMLGCVGWRLKSLSCAKAGLDARVHLTCGAECSCLVAASRGKVAIIRDLHILSLPTHTCTAPTADTMPALSHHPCLAAPAAEAQTISQHLTPGGARWPRKPTWRFGCFFVTCATFAGNDFVAQLVVGTFGSCTAAPSTAGLTWQAVQMNTIWWRELQRDVIGELQPMEELEP
ncbi:hypothetical protein C0Q70_01687 [Pomacea canaliculata]|uniref:Uncharacterized protein n=1 Tax=Pomacea canaliculata TaxID=400727 RepID=A0A2T7Q063_POMCA|nr:hypothetical protein C0Q70_01687 [Pomacea canaliculata]